MDFVVGDVYGLFSGSMLMYYVGQCVLVFVCGQSAWDCICVDTVMNACINACDCTASRLNRSAVHLN